MPFAPTITRESSLADVRGQLSDAARYALELRARPADQRDTDYVEDVRSAVDFINEFDAIERALAAGERAATAEQETRSRGGRSLGVAGDHDEPRSLGEAYTRAEGFEEWRSGGRRGPFEAEVRNLLGEYTAGAYSSGASLLVPTNSRQLQSSTFQTRRLFLRDLIGVQQTGLASFAYVRETTPVTYETGAATVAEGSAKPEVTMLFEAADAPARKIAGWLPVTDEILSDSPTLRGYIDARLAYMILIREEAQVYNGNGTAPNLQGVKGVTGVQTQSAVSGDFPATIGQAIGKVENVDGEADGVGCNPLDYWTAVTKRYANQFDNGFGGNAPGNLSGGVTWGLPTVRSRIFASGAAMVAAWSQGATIFQREGVTIRSTDSHDDYFIYNKVVILGEERIALPIWRPNLFVDVTVPTS